MLSSVKFGGICGSGPLPGWPEQGRPIPAKSQWFNGLSSAGGGCRALSRVRRPTGCESALTILRAIAIAIAHKMARRNPALRHPADGTSDCRSTPFRSWTSVPAPHRRRPRRTGRYQDGNGGACRAPETKAPRTALRARRCGWSPNRLPEPAAAIRRQRAAEPGPVRPAGDRREPAGCVARAAFRFPAAWVSCAHLLAIPCLRWGASTVDALHESGGNAAARGQLDFAMAAIGNLYPAPQAAAGPRPVRTAFSLLRFSLLANLDLHG